MDQGKGFHNELETFVSFSIVLAKEMFVVNPEVCKHDSLLLLAERH